MRIATIPANESISPEQLAELIIRQYGESWDKHSASRLASSVGIFADEEGWTRTVDKLGSARIIVSFPAPDPSLDEPTLFEWVKPSHPASKGTGDTSVERIMALPDKEDKEGTPEPPFVLPPMTKPGAQVKAKPLPPLPSRLVSNAWYLMTTFDILQNRHAFGASEVELLREDNSLRRVTLDFNDQGLGLPFPLPFPRASIKAWRFVEPEKVANAYHAGYVHGVASFVQDDIPYPEKGRTPYDATASKEDAFAASKWGEGLSAGYADMSDQYYNGGEH